MTMKASPTSLGKHQGANIATKKAAPHEAAASSPMQADEAMMTKAGQAATHEATARGGMLCNNPMTTKAASHKATASGPTQANEAIMTRPLPSRPL